LRWPLFLHFLIDLFQLGPLIKRHFLLFLAYFMSSSRFQVAWGHKKNTKTLPGAGRRPITGKKTHGCK
jgi:hypothetical protein